jgi:hypothetical protein
MFFQRKRVVSLVGKIDPVVVARHALHQKYIRRNLDELDEGVNVLTGAQLDETISSRVLRWKLNLVPHPNIFKQKFGSAMCWILGDIQPDHDLRANIGDRARAQAEIQRADQAIDAQKDKLK